MGLMSPGAAFGGRSVSPPAPPNQTGASNKPVPFSTQPPPPPPMPSQYDVAYNQWWQTMQANAAPAYGALNTNAQMIQGLGGAFASNNQFMQGNQQQDANLSQQQNALDIQGLQGNANTIPQLQAIAAQQLALQMQGYGIDRTEAGQRRDSQNRAATSDAKVRGAMFFPGIQNTLGDISNVYDNTVGRVGLGEQNANLDNQAQNLGYMQQLLETNLGIQGENLSNQQIQTALEAGLAQLGIDGMVSVQQIQEMLTSNLQEDVMLGMTLAQAAAQNANAEILANGPWPGTATGTKPKPSTTAPTPLPAGNTGVMG